MSIKYGSITRKQAVQAQDKYAEFTDALGNVKPISEQEYCDCGRVFRQVHCPSQFCGSNRVYAFSSYVIVIDRTTGKDRPINKYHCTKCGLYFTDLDRINCKAEPKPASKAVELANLAHEYKLKAQNGFPFNIKKNYNERQRFKKYVGIDYDDYMTTINKPSVSTITEEEGYLVIINDQTGIYTEQMKDAARSKLKEIRDKKLN